MPYLEDLERLQAVPTTADNALVKMQVAKLIPALNALVLPEDDDD